MFFFRHHGFSQLAAVKRSLFMFTTLVLGGVSEVSQTQCFDKRVKSPITAIVILVQFLYPVTYH